MPIGNGAYRPCPRRDHLVTVEHISHAAQSRRAFCVEHIDQAPASFVAVK